MTKKTRRINLYGPPCSGKSSTAAWIFSELKCLKDAEGKPCLEVDWVQEAAKQWTYLDRPPTGWSDQHTLFNSELEKEEIALRKVDIVVCDAPLIMNCYYGYKFDRPCWDLNVEAARRFERDFPSYNIFLDPTGIPYQTVGRFQTEEEARDMEDDVKNFVSQHHGLFIVETQKRHKIMLWLLAHLRNTGYSQIAEPRNGVEW